MLDNMNLITLDDFNNWIRKEYSSWSFARLTGDSEVTIYVPGAGDEKIGLLETELQYRKSIGITVKLDARLWIYPWQLFLVWWEKS